MADNYLEKRYEEVFLNGGAGKVRRSRSGNISLDSLLLRNRSVRGWNPEIVPDQSQLRTIISVNTRIPSARNQQVLRFRPVTGTENVSEILSYCKLGGALPELHLPLPGTEPGALIVVCSTVPAGPEVCIDLGISAQSMLLKAVELGFNGLIIRCIDKEAIRTALNLPYEVICVIALGKSAEKIQLLSIEESGDHKYYRKDGIHYVPKVRVEDLII